MPGVLPERHHLHLELAGEPAPSFGVYNFLAIDYGDYDDTTPQTPITPVQLANLTGLSETHDFTLSGELANFDVIDDGFLTTAPNGPTIVSELEIFLHTPSYAAAFVLGSTQLGSFTDPSGRAWTVAIGTGGSGQDVLFMPADQADIATGTIDVAAFFDFLVSGGTVTGTAWFNGFATGVEVRQGSGSATFNAYSVSYP